MDAPPASPIPECPGCRVWQAECTALEARVLVLETKLRDLQDRLKPPPPKRPDNGESTLKFQDLLDLR